MRTADPVLGPHFIKEETEAQRRERASPGSHRELVAERDMDSTSPRLAVHSTLSLLVLEVDCGAEIGQRGRHKSPHHNRSLIGNI